MTTGYHYHGEKRRKKDNERQWRASFRRWINEQMRLIGMKEANFEKLTEGETAIKSAHFFMTRKKEVAANAVPVN